MDARRADDVMLGAEQLDGPRQGVAIGDARVTTGPIELVEFVTKPPSTLAPKMRLRRSRGT